IFSPMSDLQSPSLGGLGASGFFGSAGLNPTSSIGRSSKLGALFPPAMQEQMRGENSRNDGPGSSFGFEAKHEGFQSSSRDPFDGSTRRRDEATYRVGLLDDNLQAGQSEDNSVHFSP